MRRLFGYEDSLNMYLFFVYVYTLSNLSTRRHHFQGVQAIHGIFGRDICHLLQLPQGRLRIAMAEFGTAHTALLAESRGASSGMIHSGRGRPSLVVVVRGGGLIQVHAQNMRRHGGFEWLLAARIIHGLVALVLCRIRNSGVVDMIVVAVIFWVPRFVDLGIVTLRLIQSGLDHKGVTSLLAVGSEEFADEGFASTDRRRVGSRATRIHDVVVVVVVVVWFV